MWDPTSEKIAHDFLANVPLGQDFWNAVKQSKTVVAASAYEEIALILWVDNQSEKDPGWTIAGAITSIDGIVKTITANNEDQLVLLRWKSGKVEHRLKGLWIPAEYTPQGFIDQLVVMLEIRSEMQKDLLAQVIAKLNK